MNKTSIQMTLIAIVLLLAQVIVFNNVCLFNVAVPFAFLYIIMRLPLTMSLNWSVTIGFAVGLIVDVFADTQGMNALSCTIIAALRRPILRLYFPRQDELTDPCPSMASLGFSTYLRYALTMSLVYSTMYFFIEAFSLFNFWTLILRIIASTLLTTILLICIDSIIVGKNEKRL